MSGIGNTISGLFGGGGSRQGPATQIVTNQQNIPSWLQPFYTGTGGTTGILPEAEEQYGQPFEYFPDSTVVPFSGTTQTGLEAIRGMAAEGSPISDAASGTLEGILSGDYLGQNPYIDDVVGHVTDDATRAANTSAYFSGAEGSPAHARAIAQGVGEATAPIRYSDYQNERGLMQQAFGLAPAIDELRYAAAQKQLGVGGAEEAKSYEELQDAIARYDFEQQEPRDRLARYAALVGGAPVLSSSTQSTYSPSPSFSGSGLLGGALGGYQVGSDLGIPLIGAGLGGLLGGYG